MIFFEFEFSINKIVINLTKNKLSDYSFLSTQKKVTYTEDVRCINFIEHNFKECFIFANVNSIEESIELIDNCKKIGYGVLKILFINGSYFKQELIDELKSLDIHCMVNYTDEQIKKTIQLMMDITDNFGFIGVDYLDIRYICRKLPQIRMVIETNVDHLLCVKNLLNKLNDQELKDTILFIEHNEKIKLRTFEEIIKEIEKATKQNDLIYVSNFNDKNKFKLTLYY